MSIAESLNFLIFTDLFEGVRALLVDKDNKPKWNPSKLADVSDAILERYFSNLPTEQELKLPSRDVTPPLLKGVPNDVVAHELRQNQEASKQL